MEEKTRSGGCLCGAVRYTVRGEPFHVGRCHCADCRKRSGSTYAIYGHWPLSSFESTGEYATYGEDSFCPRCGSRLFLLGENTVELELGSLDNAPSELRPQAELWIKRREPRIPEVDGARSTARTAASREVPRRGPPGSGRGSSVHRVARAGRGGR